MIDRKPSAVDVAHSWTAPWQSPRYLGTLSACQACARRRQGETESGDTSCGCPSCSVSPAWGSNRCLQQVPLGKGLGAHSDFVLGSCTRRLDTLLDPLEIKISWARLGSEASHLASKTAPRLPTRPDLDVRHYP